MSKPPRQPPPPTNRGLRKPDPKPSETVKVDEDAIAKKVADMLGGKLDARDNKLREELMALISKNRDGGIDVEVLKAVLSDTVKGAVESARPVVVQGGAVPSKKRSEDPHYIPTNIIPSDAKASIAPKESTTDAGKTDSAAAKLKALRKNRDKENP